MEKEKKNSYYLKYLFKGNEIIVDVLNNKVLKNQKGQELIKTPGFKFKCLLMISKNKKEKVSWIKVIFEIILLLLLILNNAIKNKIWKYLYFIYNYYLMI